MLAGHAPLRDGNLQFASGGALNLRGSGPRHDVNLTAMNMQSTVMPRSATSGACGASAAVGMEMHRRLTRLTVIDGASSVSDSGAANPHAHDDRQPQLHSAWQPRPRAPESATEGKRARGG